jgi:2-polyprenyl-6-methoxyphenol hydroxylase-like FAD-dependent oxidoreductase
MAFEDAIVLCRGLATILKPGESPSQQAIAAALQEFENMRLPRVRTIWDDQWERAERSYQNNEEMEPWSPDFAEWVYQGV